MKREGKKDFYKSRYLSQSYQDARDDSIRSLHNSMFPCGIVSFLQPTFLGQEEIRKYNKILWVDSNYPPAVLLGSEYYNDMRTMDEALIKSSVPHELIDPLAERNLQMPHCFVTSELADSVAKDAFDRMMAFIRQRV